MAKQALGWILLLLLSSTSLNTPGDDGIEGLSGGKGVIAGWELLLGLGGVAVALWVAGVAEFGAEAGGGWAAVGGEEALAGEVAM